MNRRPAEFLRGLVTLAVLVVAVAGVPVALYRFGGQPIPSRLPTVGALLGDLRRHDSGAVFLAAVRDASWLAWAAFSTAILAEAWAAARGSRAVRVSLPGMQNLAGRLVAVAALTFAAPVAITLAAAPALAATARPAATARSAVSAGSAATTSPAASRAADSPAAGTATRAGPVVVVRPGDCLWTIAQRYLGAGDRYREIARLNIGRRMDDGRVFRDPSLILPGWRLRLPRAGQQALDGINRTGHAVGRADQPSTSEYGTVPGHAAPDVRHGAGSASVGSEPARSGATTSRGGHGGKVGLARAGAARPGAAADWPALAGTFGLGMLAGGVLSSLDRLRRRQRAGRRAGHRIAVPADPDGARIERRLRATARPGGAPVRDLPALLSAGLAEFRAAVSRAGLPLPPVVGVHLLGDSLDVLLSAPAEGPPPPPFSLTPGCAQMCWSATVPAPTDPTGGGSDPVDNAALLPGLVTVGSTDEGGYLLLDLEAMPVAGCAGPVEAVDRMILTIATEIAAIDRGRQRHLVLVGCAGLGVLGTVELASDLDTAIDLLAERAATVASRLPGARPGAVRACRAADPGDQDWGLSLLISRVPPTPEQMSRLLDLTGGPGGIAALVAGDIRASNGHATPAVFRLEPDPADAATICATVMLPGLGPDRPVTVRAQTLTLAEYRALTGVLATAACDPGPGGDVGTAGDPDAADALPWTRLAAAPVDPALPLPVGGGGPQVRVLGPIEIAGVAAPLRPDQTELMLALAVHAPLGLPTSALSDLLGPDADHPSPPDAVRRLIGETGPLLGPASDGRSSILHQGGGVYALHPDVGLDWADFSALAVRGMAEEATDVLWAALNLVRGEPFGGWPSWWIDIGLIETIRAEIVDVAHALARLEIRAGNAAAGCRAARAGLAAESTAEELWRALMSAEHAAGNPAGVVAAWSGCLAAITEIDPGADPHPDTQLLFHRLSGQRVSAGASLDAR